MPGDSLQQKVRAAKRKREAGETVKVPLPGYKGMLVGVYELADWQKRVEITIAREEAAQENENRAQAIWDLAAAHLLASSKTVEAVDGQERQELPPLGVQLASWLGVNETKDGDPLALTDLDALPLIIEDGEELIEHFGQVLAAQGRLGERVDEKIVGESVAAS